MTLDKEQRMEEARSWSNFWTGLAVTAVGVSALTIIFDFGSMGWTDLSAAGWDDLATMALRVAVGGLLGHVLQRQAILALRHGARP